MDDDVVGQLLDTAATRLAAYGYLLTGSQIAGDELIRSAIVKVSVRHRRLRDVRALEGRVKLAMRTIYLDDLRRAGTWRARLPRLGARGGVQDVPGPSKQPSDDVGRALAQLSSHERAVVVLRHYDQLEVLQIAEAMRITEGAAREHLAHAHATLGRTLGEIAPEVDRILVVDGRRR